MPIQRTTFAAAFVAAAFLFTATAHAELSRADKKQAEKMLAGTLYLRTDAPCTQGRQPFGVYLSPLVEISPKGINTEADQGASFGWYHASSTVWGVRVNDTVELDETDWDEDTVEIELTGVGRTDGHDTVVKFVEIRSLADFEAAFKLAFSNHPLQDEHPDWPADIRKAIADRKLVPGMNKRQAYYVVGTPEQVEKTTEGEKKIETWTLRKQGLEIGFFTVNPGDPSAPAEKLRFEDGVLVTSDTHNPSQIDLDN
ncbi:MAG TPA: hypothetical protein VGS22_07530 [Thermoanaerobaculia bacterium]|jgi:hypothetical protein|nr:hypothetical protein [Thermoanaerobaculia bacterium]